MAAPLHNLTDWAERNPDARTVPDHVLVPAERVHQAQTFTPTDATHADVVASLIDEALTDLNGRYAERRKTEQMVVDYLSRYSLYPKLIDRLSCCRKHGALGYRCNEHGEPRHLVAWSEKCGVTRLCPDESRQEQKRLAKRYVPAMLDWVHASPWRQLKQIVLTVPNVPRGQLHKMKRELMERTKKWLKDPLGRIAPLKAELKVTEDKAMRKQLRKRISEECARLPIKGALVSQEDPLSKHDNWNVHQNALIETQGPFPYAEARMAWYELTKDLFPDDAEKMKKGWDFFARDITKEKDLTRAIMELVKYQVKLVSSSKPGADGTWYGADQAPPLVAWPAAAFIEWWEAGYSANVDKRGRRSPFRRTRSYGALYKLKAEDKPSVEGVTWVGQINYNQASGRYTLTESIRFRKEDNFFGTGEAEKDNSCLNFGQGPPTQAAGGEFEFVND